MVLTVFLAIRAAQKHASAAECQRSRRQKRGKVFTQAFSRKRALTALPILLRPAEKLTSSAKVRLREVFYVFRKTVGLLVVDQKKYAQYRAEIAPLLEAAGARFRYDFDVARTMKTEVAHDINRVFLIQFPNRAARSGSSRIPIMSRSAPLSSRRR